MAPELNIINLFGQNLVSREFSMWYWDFSIFRVFSILVYIMFTCPDANWKVCFLGSWCNELSKKWITLVSNQNIIWTSFFEQFKPCYYLYFWYSNPVIRGSRLQVFTVLIRSILSFKALLSSCFLCFEKFLKEHFLKNTSSRLLL